MPSLLRVVVSALCLFVVALGSSSANAAPGSGMPGNDDSTGVIAPPNAQVGTGSLGLSCTIQVGGATLTSATVEAETVGALPAVLAPGQSWQLTNGKGQVTLPASVADELYSLGVRTISGKVTKLTIQETGAANATADGATSNDIVVPSTPVVQGQPIVVTVGETHPFTIGPFPAAAAPGLIHVVLGETETAVTGYTAGGVPLLSATTDCPAPNPEQLLATIDVGGAPSSGTVSEPGDFPLADIPDDSLIGSTGAI